MNAFQIGIATFKWNAKDSKYSIRPFNFYVWPGNTTIMDKRVMQFDTSSLKFLIDNNFNFNKLFKEGLTYQKLSDKDLIHSRIAKVVGDAPPYKRFYTSLGQQSQTSLKDYLVKCQDFVEKTRSDTENQHFLELQIESYALKKQLARDLYVIYGEQNLIYTNYSKDSDKFTIKKQRQKEETKNSAEEIINSKFAEKPNGQGPQKTTNPEINQIDSKMQGLKLDDEDRKESENRERMFLQELGFGHVMELLIKKCQTDFCPIIGHNMIYDIIYVYNQFVGDLPSTYTEFSQCWFNLFPLTYDTKVLSFKAQYTSFSKTILGKIFEKCQNDKRLKDILGFQFDLKNGFSNYHGSDLLSHYHEAAYDAYMTGYAFARILKYKEIDEVYHSNKEKGKNSKEKFIDPKTLNNSALNFSHKFAKWHQNQVMLNQFDDCACFFLNPEKGEALAKRLSEFQE